MSDTWWLARAELDGQISTLRCATAGEAPGPLARWEPIGDVFEVARRDPAASLLALVAASTPLQSASGTTKR